MLPDRVTNTGSLTYESGALPIALRGPAANSVFFKTLSKSIYISNMIKGGGQGGLKRKNY